MIVEKTGVELSYCYNCGNAKIVGIFLVKGWHHSVRMCSHCLEQFAKEIDEHFNTMEKIREVTK